MKSQAAIEQQLANVIAGIESGDIQPTTRARTEPGAHVIHWDETGRTGLTFDPDGTHEVHTAKFGRFDRVITAAIIADLEARGENVDEFR